MKTTGTVLFILSIVLGVVASPVDTGPSSGYVEHHREGKLIWYGPSGTAQPRSVSLDKRSCSTTASPSCGTAHQARNNICDQLVTELNGDSSIAVPKSPRQICYEGDAIDKNQYCCVSWGTVIPGLTKGDLAGYANTILSTCTANGVSGKFGNIMVRNTCSELCLSNRGTHC